MPSLDDLTWPRRTPRLEIRRITVEDADAMFDYRSLEEVARWEGSLPTDRQAFVADMTEGDKAPYNLAVVADGTLVGDLYCHVEDGWAQKEVAARARGAQAEIGWTIAPAHQGRGFATEAAGELLGLCFRPSPEGLGVRRVHADLFAPNVASARLCERLGMRREAHHVRDALQRSGEWMDTYVYGLLAEEWLHAG